MKEVKRHFLISSLVLAISTVFAKVLGAVYRIPLANILKSEGIGLYQLVFPIYAFLIVLVSSGFSLALTRECSVYFKEEKPELAKKLFRFAVLLCIVLSLIGSVILVAFAPLIAKLQGNNFLFWLYLVFAASIVFSSIASIFRGYFMAKEQAIIPAIYNVIAQGLKLLAGLGLATLLAKHGMLYACLGAALGISVSEILAFLFLLIILKIKKKPQVANGSNLVAANEFKLAKKKFIKAGLLITISVSLVPLLYMLDGLLIVKLLCGSGHTLAYATTCYGELYGITNSLINLPVMLAGSVSLALMPTLSKVADPEERLNKARTGINAALLVSIFCFVCFLVFSPKIISFLYGENYTSFNLSKTLLSLSSISVLTLSLIPILGGILQSQGNFFSQTISLIIAGVLKITATLILAFCFNLNIIALAIINILCFIIVVILNYIKICRVNKAPLIPIGLLLKYLILTAAGVGTATGLRIIFSGLPVFLSLLICGISLAVLYILFIFVLKLFKIGNN